MDDPVEGYRKTQEQFRKSLEQAFERVPVAERADAMEEMVDMLVDGGLDISRSDLSKASPWAFSESIAEQPAVMDLLCSYETLVEGRLPRGVGIANLRDAPVEWSLQYARLGLAP